MADDDKPGNDDQSKLTDDPAFKQMQDAVKGLSTIVQQQAAQNVQLNKNFEAMVSKLDNLGTPKKDDKDANVDPESLNDLDNVGLMRLTLTEVGKLLDDKLGKVDERFEATTKDLSDTKLSLEVKEFMKDHKDLLDWKDEITALAKDNPNLSIERLYTLARTEDTDKAADLDKKYSPDEGDETEDKGFMGLMPTSGGMITDDSEDKPKTIDEAAERAFAETLEAFPALEQSTSDA